MSHVTVCICTFRRDSITAAVESVAAQELPEGASLSVVVADNDETPSARPIIEALDKANSVPVTYVHAPARNISIARNACLDHAIGEWAAFLDDDEYAPPDWLSDLLEAAQKDQLDVVFGAAKADYADDTPRWIKDRDYHSNIPERRNGEVQTGHTCNAMIRREHPLIKTERFRLDKGRTGGEDTEFFFRLWRKGVRLGISDTANVFEPVDPKRLNFNWIMTRKFRSGISYGRHSLDSDTLIARSKLLAVSAAKIAYSGLRALLQLPFQTNRNYWLFRAGFHSGVASSVFRVREQELYG